MFANVSRSVAGVDCDLSAIIHGSRESRLISPATTSSNLEEEAERAAIVQAVKESGSNKSVTCSNCSSKFTSKAGLRIHRNKHCEGMDHNQDGRQVGVRVRRWNQRIQGLDPSMIHESGPGLVTVGNGSLQTASDTEVRKL